MKQKRALITGGGSGIGLACAHALSAQGHDVIVAGRNAEALEKTGLQPVVMDVTQPNSVQSALKAAGTVDIFVANAGAAETAPLLKTSPDMWARMLAVNLTGVFHCAQAAIPPMIEKGWGRFIVVASTAALITAPYSGAYVSTKHGVLGLVKSLALELARTGVTCNAVCPGFTDTPLLDRAIDNITGKTEMSKEQALAALVRNNPMKRPVSPEEVASAVLWLSGDGAAATNGIALPVDGGELVT